MSQRHVSDAAGENEVGGNIGGTTPGGEAGPDVAQDDAARVAAEYGVVRSNKDPVNSGLRAADIIDLEAKELSLTPKQVTALILLAAGYRQYEAAFEVGVSRMTLHRWMTKDAAFIAAYNAHTNDYLGTVRAQLMNGLGHAAATLLREIRTNANLAYKMLKDAGVTTPGGGTLCVEEIRAELELEARKRKTGMRQDAMGLDSL